MRTIGIVGSRRRNAANDMVFCVAAFDRVYCPGDWVVSGGCPKGADNFAECLIRVRCLPAIIYYPQYDLYPIPRCYFERNTLVAEECDVLIALVSATRTGGTEDTVRKALRLGRIVHLITDENSPVFQGPLKIRQDSP